MSQRLGAGLTILNVVLLILLLANQVHSASADQPTVPSVLRGSALEIVDGRGRVRASISVHGPETVNGIRYPETVLLRMSDPKSRPLVKLTVSENGSALGLSDYGSGGIQLYARDTASFVRVVDKQGRERVVRP
ncbi:MAG: hypothetical protein ACJ79N_04400 [Gemmatimonadaceae bacterium]